MENKLYNSIICILLFVIGFLLFYEKGVDIEFHQSDLDSLDGGDYLRVVFIGSSNCAFSNNEEMHDMVVFIKNRIREVAYSADLKIVTTGISQDLMAVSGVTYLEKTGPYDEVISGGGWYNMGLNRYVWEVFEGPALTPQILVTKTVYNVSDAGSQIGNIQKEELILNRSLGIQEINEFYKYLSENEMEVIIENLKI